MIDEEAVARAIIAEIFAGVPEPHRPKTPADMPEEQAARFRAAGRAAITAFLSAGEPDGMETTVETRAALFAYLRAETDGQLINGRPASFFVEALQADFDRLLAALTAEAARVQGEADARADRAKIPTYPAVPVHEIDWNDPGVEHGYVPVSRASARSLSPSETEEGG